METPLHKQLTNYIKLHRQVLYDDIPRYAKENHYKEYTAIRRLQEVREPKHPNYDPDIGTIEENGTIRWYIYKPAFMQEPRQTQNLPRREEIQTPPAQNYQTPPKPVRWQDSPEYKRPIHTCCLIAIACYEKRLPVTHSQGCVEKQAASHS
jgi:hypothetical protein